jgi:hypothetical protein
MRSDVEGRIEIEALIEHFGRVYLLDAVVLERRI